ncbi:flavin reductase family protein [Breoghania sp.]|uniref:flavin reductase family protein n=1 Tax=Breoghania sp. TaxID=2065378 RepID=UPI002616516D|nr:flavin reductase family protein [Breoghania sp.]MDJ0930036.1 flavin reductase family protein [Breoghania sp.]
MTRSEKRDFPVEEARHFLEPGPVVLISSHCDGASNIMTLGWHSILAFAPSLVNCMISSGNHSFEMIRRTGECVINLPTLDLADIVSKVGNCTGSEVDKFAEFGLTAKPAEIVYAPLIDECHACFECRVYDDAMVNNYNYFIFEIVKAHVAGDPEHPKTIHYMGDGKFMVAGDVIDRKEFFTKVN